MSKVSHIREAREKLLAGIGVPEIAPFVIDRFQQEAISHVTNGEDTLVVAPTGSGKTFIALQAIDASLFQGLRAVYTTPLKALSNSKYTELKAKFEPEKKVGLLTGDRKIECDADVVVATTEIYRNELYRFRENFSLVVLDEVHFISDQQRGAVWEESIILTPASATLLMLSASISNAREIAEWIEDVRGKSCKVVLESNRSVELRYGFLHPDYGVIPISDDQGRLMKEVFHYYGGAHLDGGGLKLKGSKFRNGRIKGRKSGRGR